MLQTFLRGRSAVATCAFVWLLSGCAGAPEHSTPIVTGEPRAHHLTSVPFFPDATDQCGPATLASVLTFWGVTTDPKTLKNQVYLPKLRGSLPIDMLLAAQALGLKADSYKGSIEDIRKELEAGHPLVAFLNLGWGPFTQGHYIVITGFDDRRGGIFAHSGLMPDDFLPYELFLPDWEKTGRWTLKILPPQDGVGRNDA